MVINIIKKASLSLIDNWSLMILFFIDFEWNNIQLLNNFYIIEE